MHGPDNERKKQADHFVIPKERSNWIKIKIENSKYYVNMKNTKA